MAKSITLFLVTMLTGYITFDHFRMERVEHGYYGIALTLIWFVLFIISIYKQMRELHEVYRDDINN